MKVLIIGLGSIAKKHISVLRSLDTEIEIYALRSNKKSRDYKGVTNFYDLKNINIDIDFAIISNPTYLHAKYIELLSEKNVSLFIEKPPLSSLVGSQKIINSIKKNNIKTYVACNLRFHPCIVFIKNYIKKNKLKKINEVNIYCGSYLPNWRPKKNFRKTYSAVPEMGGGVHLDLFHELDYALWLFGDPKSSQKLTRSSSSLKISAMDYANYILEYEKFAVNIVLNYYRVDSKRSIEILFEDKTLEIDLLNNIIFNNKREVLYENKEYNIIESYKAQMKSFIEILNKKQNQINTFENSIRTLKICLGEQVIKK